MVTEHKLLKGTPEEIAEYITSLPNYTSGLGDKLDIKKQLDEIGLEKPGIVFYLEKRSDTEIALVSVYVHIIDLVKRSQSLLGKYMNTDDVVFNTEIHKE